MKGQGNGEMNGNSVSFKIKRKDFLKNVLTQSEYNLFPHLWALEMRIFSY